MLRATGFVVGPLLMAVLAGAAEAGRVATLAPSHTEIVVALGAGSALVAVSDAENPGDFSSLPRVGGLPPRWEALVALRPDLVLADAAHRRFEKDFRRFRLPVRFLAATRARTVEDVLDLIREAGEALGRQDQAAKLAGEMTSRLEALDRERPAGPGPTAFLEVWPRPLQAAGPASLQGNLLARAGFRNILPDTRNEMPLVSGEWVVQSAPEYLFHTGSVSPDAIAGRPAWSSIPAVREGRVIKLDADLISRAGPRVVEALELLSRIRNGERPPRIDRK